MDNDLRYVISAILDCGTADLDLLGKINYDIDDIKEEIKGYDETINLQNILSSAIYIYKSNIQSAVENILNDTEDMIKSLEQYCDENNNNVDDKTLSDLKYYQNKYDEINELDVIEDIEMFVNYLDTHIYINDDDTKAIYKKYFNDIIDEENDNIGFVSLDLD